MKTTWIMTTPLLFWQIENYLSRFSYISPSALGSIFSKGGKWLAIKTTDGRGLWSCPMYTVYQCSNCERVRWGGWARIFISLVYIFTKIVGLGGWGGGVQPPNPPRQFEPCSIHSKITNGTPKSQWIFCSVAYLGEALYEIINTPLLLLVIIHYFIERSMLNINEARNIIIMPPKVSYR